MRSTTPMLVAVLALLGSVAACSDDAGPTTPAAGASITGEVVVFAASSLTEAFTEIADEFTAANPGTEITFNFAGSGDLFTQISEGAPADVYAAADTDNMTRLTETGLNATKPVTIAGNTFEIIVERGNPQGITGLADLTDPGLVVVLCADTVPCGNGARQVLTNAGVTLTPKSLEDKVKGVVTKVTLGEADAGIVFVTDVNAAGDTAAGVEIPANVNVVSEYPMVVTSDAPNPAAAQAFVDFVAGPTGQAILAAQGFLEP